MKKVFLFLTITIVTLAGIFADKNSFYKDGQLVDVLYVDASSGLRVRDNPTLKAQKIGTVDYRMAVKPVKVGSETTIDGIKSNWIKIVMPLDTIKKGYTCYGWVFGGYLSNEPAAFSTKNWTDDDVYNYLGRFAWISGARTFTEYKKNGRYSCGLMESGTGGEGTYTASAKTKTVTVKACWGDEDQTSDVKTDVNKFEYIKETEFRMEGFNVSRPAMFATDYFFYDFTKENPNIDTFDETAVNALFYKWSSEMIKELDSKYNLNETFFENMKKMGVILFWKEGYMDDYHEHWYGKIRFSED